jgi:hypothetical protein
VRRAGAAALLLLVAACSGGDPTVEAAPGTTGRPATTTTATTATTLASTTATTAGAACPAGDLTPSTGEVASVGAEVDGLAGDDTAYAHLADDGWHLRIDLGDGGATDELLATAPADVARVLRARDLDGDGTDELWVQVGTGAAATIVGLYDVDGCDLEPVLADGAPAEFAIGGTVLLLQGLACGESDVTHLGATSEDGVTYATLDLTYELRAGELVRVGDETNTITADDLSLASYSEFAC